MADYAFFTMFGWLVKRILIFLLIVLLTLLVGWIYLSFHNRLLRRALFIFLIVVLIASVTMSVIVNYYQSPMKIIERTNAIPLIDGIILMHAHQNAGFDSAKIWLHFKMSPEAFDAILSSESYTILPYQNLNFDAYSPPKWWNINSLDGCTFYQCESSPALGYDVSAKDIVVNEDKTEVYFLMRCWYYP